MAGYSRTPRKVKPKTPNTMIKILITVAVTGRRREKSDMFTDVIYAVSKMRCKAKVED
jgi:hypothetical protein